MTFKHFLTDPFAPHPVVNSRNICFGGGGGGGDAPDTPDYSGYIAEMSKIGARGQERSTELYDWAKEHGLKLDKIADTVSGRAGDLADQGAGTYKEMMQKWKDTYGGLYDAQAADARRMIGELPNTEEQYAGKYQADVAQAFDASKEAHDRNLRSYGLKQPGGGATQLDSMVSNQRRLGQVAAAEQGRMAARNEARGVTQNAIQSGLALPQVAGQGSSLALAGGNQQIGAPESAIATTASAMQPSIGYYSAATPYMKAWGDTMSNEYNQKLAKYKAESESSGGGGGGIGGMLGGLAGSVAGSFMGPMGGALGGMAGKALGGAMGFAEGGEVGGGDQVVTPDMSQSEGAITDDVPARLNVGEFVIPKDVVQWRGEAWMQKEIMKARKEREQNTVAEPEMAPAGAIDMQAPQFQSGQEPPL